VSLVFGSRGRSQGLQSWSLQFLEERLGQFGQGMRMLPVVGFLVISMPRFLFCDTKVSDGKGFGKPSDSRVLGLRWVGSKKNVIYIRIHVNTFS
jgi:hypothetical protein